MGHRRSVQLRLTLKNVLSVHLDCRPRAQMLRQLRQRLGFSTRMWQHTQSKARGENHPSARTVQEADCSPGVQLARLQDDAPPLMLQTT